MSADQLHHRLFLHHPGAEGLDHHRDRLGHPDGVSELHFQLAGQSGRHQVLGHVAGHVGGRAIHLGRVLPGERPAAVVAGAAVGVHDDLAPAQPAITVGSPDHEAPGGVDVVLGVVVEHLGGDDGTDDLLDDPFPDSLDLHVVAVLGGDDHGVHPPGAAVLVFNRDLGLAVRSQELQRAVAAAAGQLLGQPVRQHDGHRHQLRSLIAGQPEHHPLVAGPAGVDAAGDVGRLLLDGNQHRATVGVEPVAGVGVADTTNGLAGDGGVIEVGLGGDFPGDQRQPGGYQRLAGHPPVGVLLQDGVENRVRDLIGEFVRVPLGDRFRSKKIPPC